LLGVHFVEELPEAGGAGARSEEVYVEGGGEPCSVRAAFGDGGEGPGATEVKDEGQGPIAHVAGGGEEMLQVAVRALYHNPMLIKCSM